MNLEFTKMQGLGNDYIYVSCFNQKICNPTYVAKVVSDRHFGIGGDGLVLIMKSDEADFKMRMFNLDGSEAEMCGNAIRCVGKYVYDNNMINKTNITIETLGGIKELKLFIKEGKVSIVQVDMGEPIIEAAKIPVLSNKNSIISENIKVDDEKTYSVTCVSMGNPHTVVYVEDVENFPVSVVGPQIEKYEKFIKKTNVEFVQIVNRELLKIRVWERGSGETLACGTGACAALVSSVLNNVSDRKVNVELLGGILIIEWNQENNHVYMTGPAVKVFDGVITLENEEGNC